MIPTNPVYVFQGGSGGIPGGGGATGTWSGNAYPEPAEPPYPLDCNEEEPSYLGMEYEFSQGDGPPAYYIYKFLSDERNDWTEMSLATNGVDPTVNDVWTPPWGGDSGFEVDEADYTPIHPTVYDPGYLVEISDPSQPEPSLDVVRIEWSYADTYEILLSCWTNFTDFYTAAYGVDWILNGGVPRPLNPDSPNAKYQIISYKYRTVKVEVAEELQVGIPVFPLSSYFQSLSGGGGASGEWDRYNPIARLFPDTLRLQKRE
jgi:hypothetical protein